MDKSSSFVSVSLGDSRPSSAFQSAGDGTHLADSRGSNSSRKVKISWLEFIGCFCCWTLHGLRMLLTNIAIIQYGLGFIISDTFAQLIKEFVRSVMIPFVFAIFSSPKIYRVQAGNGWVSLTDPRLDNEDTKVITPFVSEFDARENGAQVIQYQSFIVAFVNFFLVLASTYWASVTLVNWGKKNLHKQLTSSDFLADSVLIKTRECEYCMSKIPHDSKRCPKCTSFLSNLSQQNLKTQSPLTNIQPDGKYQSVPTTDPEAQIPTNSLSENEKQYIIQALSVLLNKGNNNNKASGDNR